ncbi:cholesterol esterase [Streptomyces daghestanicus]|uniref:Cholesterol esterase n=2 Tax=Streptomyces TaxID=1883 RepID=A0A918GBB5_STRGD|nr:cholesterol esterase [Streptomyces niveoruber]GGS83902.1 cholesterol esterase [Streptomyces griseoviridis]GGU45099.1 cholesterol esterase [Streptomyces daghestanicus]GHI30888.1 cholesterol esterase [Streptomyces daghestanicus]
MVMVPSVAATAAIGVALAQGALAASFSVSGQQFKVTAKELTGHGFSQYGAYDDGATGRNAVAVSAFKTADIDKLCQSVVTNVPLLGPVTLRLEAGDTSKKQEMVYAEQLYIDVADLKADATFSNIDIGVAAGAIDKGPGIKSGDHADPRGFAQQATEAKLTDVEQTAWATTAGTFKLSGLHMSLKKGSGKDIECY